MKSMTFIRKTYTCFNTIYKVCIYEFDKIIPQYQLKPAKILLKLTNYGKINY